MPRDISRDFARPPGTVQEEPDDVHDLHATRGSNGASRPVVVGPHELIAFDIEHRDGDQARTDRRARRRTAPLYSVGRRIPVRRGVGKHQIREPVGCVTQESVFACADVLADCREPPIASRDVFRVWAATGQKQRERWLPFVGWGSIELDAAGWLVKIPLDLLDPEFLPSTDARRKSVDKAKAAMEPRDTTERKK